MNTDQIARLEKLLERELSAEEKERLRRIRDTLHLSDRDAVWDLFAAMEYQKTYYVDLPQKISAASTEILRNISEAAEAEARLAQGRLTESVVEQAHKLALRVNLSTLLPMGLCALVCMMLFGSLAMWAGFSLGSGHYNDLFWILRMPSGILVGLLALAGGLCLGVHAARELAAEEKLRWKEPLVAVVMLVAGGMLVAFAL